ncbi:MAG: C40 family peptidase [Chthonomonas sp.]|nr:C40 family peptidase [Chthonomonas sp.]
MKPGDNDHSIAQKYGISVSQLHQANSGIDWRKLQIGKSLNIPGKPKPVSKAKPVSAPKANATHIVVAGESDWSVSRKYGLSVAQLQALNPGVTLSPLRLGAKLRVHKAGVATKPVAKAPIKPALKPVAKATATKPQAKPVAKAAATTPALPVGITSVNAEVNGTGVALRSAGATSAGKIASLNKGNVGQVIDRQGDWYRLKFTGGIVGWVSGDLLKNTSKATTPIPTAAKPKATAPTSVAMTTGLSSSAGKSLITTALAQQGVRYVWGGTSRNGFDCSGFVQYVFRQHGVNLPRTSREQATRGTPVSKGALRAGDCLFFVTRGRSISHVGIYIGNNRFVHASSGGGRVRVNELSGYYANRFAGARRMSSKFLGSEVAQLEFDNWANSLPIESVPDDIDPEPDMVVSQNRGADIATP